MPSAPGPEDRRLKRILRKFAAAQLLIDREEERIKEATGSTMGAQARINRTMEVLDAEVRAWLATDFLSVFAAGVLVAGDAKASMSGLLRHALANLQADTYMDLARATTAISDDVKGFIRTVSRVRVEAHLLEGIDPAKSKRLLRKELAAAGIRFTDKAGRRWKLDRYAEVVVRTKTAQAYNTGTVLRASESGTRQFRVFDGTQDEPCRAANGTIVNSDWALANPVAHPNCVRAFGPLPFGEPANA